MPLINFFRQRAQRKKSKKRARLIRAAHKVGYPLERELNATSSKGKFVSAESMAREIIGRQTLRARIKRFKSSGIREHAKTLDYQEKPVLDKMQERRKKAELLKQMKKNQK